MPEKFLKNELIAPFTFSQSSLQDYSDCPRRFQLRYIEKLQWPAVETAPVLENERRQIEGQQFHRMVQQVLLGLPVEKMNQMASHSGSNNLARWWGNFTMAHSESLSGLTDQILYPEQSLSVPVNKHRIVAKYDLIAVKDGQTTIYDWKTNHKRPKDEWMVVRLQTRVYLSMLIKAGANLNKGQAIPPEQVEMVYWYADFPSEPSRFGYDTARHIHDWGELTSLISEISAKRSFPLTSDEKKCGFCKFRSFCERGVSASDGEENEDAAEFNWSVNLEQVQELEF